MEILSKEQIVELAPAVYAEEPANITSDRYSFVPTYKLVDLLHNKGWEVVKAHQTNMKGVNSMHSYHALTFRHVDDLRINFASDEIIPEVILDNNHAAKRRFKFLLGLFRMVCSNGLIIADQTYAEVQKVHKGLSLNSIESIIDNTLTGFKGVHGQIEDFQGIILNKKQRVKFAKDSIKARYSAPVEMDLQERALGNVEAFLKIRRQADRSKDLWTTYNVLQENLIEGGINLEIKKDEHFDSFNNDMFNLVPEPSIRKSSAKPLRDNNRKNNLNQVLWGLMANYYGKLS